MEIEIQHMNVGMIQFRQEPPTGRRTADGFRITLPLTLRLRPTPQKALFPMLSGLRGTLSISHQNGSMLEIGRLRSDDFYTGSSAEFPMPASTEWVGTLASLAVYEQLRDGRPPNWHVQFAGEIHLLAYEANEPLKLTYAPQSFHGQEQLTIPAEAWAMLLQQLGVLDILCVQIPLPEPAPGPMTPVWTALETARDDFKTGGITGWRSCGIHLRQALTDWEAEHKLDTGKGIADRKTLTKDQRLDNLRFLLREFTHIAGHPDPAIAKTWTRDDALLALSTMCALLNAKKP